MSDVLIVGGGPAGVTAALYTARAGFSTSIICRDSGALGRAALVDNFYGLGKIGGAELVESGLLQAREVGVNVTPGEVVGIAFDDGQFNLHMVGDSSDGNLLENAARAVVLATGATRTTPKIKGLAELDGRGVSYCAVCDGFFYKGKDVAVLGADSYALHEVEDLLPLAKTVTLLTNGATPSVTFPASVIVRTEKITEVLGKPHVLGTALRGVLFESKDAEELPLDGLFIAIGVAGGTELARKIGAIVQNNAVVVDADMRTNVAGLWAAGDCIGGMKQIAKAVHNGAAAGMDIVKFLREK